MSISNSLVSIPTFIFPHIIKNICSSLVILKFYLKNSKVENSLFTGLPLLSLEYESLADNHADFPSPEEMKLAIILFSKMGISIVHSTALWLSTSACKKSSLVPYVIIFKLFCIVALEIAEIKELFPLLILWVDIGFLCSTMLGYLYEGEIKP